MKRILLITALICPLLWAGEDLIVERKDIPYNGEKELDVDIEFGLGKLELRSNHGKRHILNYEIQYSRDYFRPRIDYKRVGDRGKLMLVSTHKEREGFWGHMKKSDAGKMENNYWKTAFIRSVPTTFDIEMGLGKGQLDFTDIQVSDLSLECGMSDVVIEFNERNARSIRYLVIETGLGNVEAYGLGNANTERFDIECGLGSTTLRFDGKLQNNIKGKVTVGLGSVNLQIPDNVGVQFEAESSFLSSIDFSGFRQIDENLYRSRNWRDASRRMYFIIEIGLGSVDIEWLD